MAGWLTLYVYKDQMARLQCSVLPLLLKVNKLMNVAVRVAAARLDMMAHSLA